MLRRLIAAAAVSALALFSVPHPAVAQSAAPDLLVVGGTPAGVAAAVAAARHGERVVLTTRGAELGGILTDAMMDQWDLNVGPDGETIQGGLFREIYAALGDAFTPAAAAQEFAALVAREGRVRVVTDARPADVAVDVTARGRSVRSVRFVRRDGSTFDVAAERVVDASDDGDVAAMAGAPYDVGRQDTGIDERMQPVTLMFTVRDVEWPAVEAAYAPSRLGPGGASDRRAWGFARLMRAYRPSSPQILVRDLNLAHMADGEVTANAIDVLGIDGRSDEDLARARTLTEREAPRLVAWLRARLPGFERASVGRYARAVYVRETRHFAGIETVTAPDVWNGRIPNDVIGLSSYPLDLHPVTARDALAYAPERHVYGVPFGALVPRTLTNLLIASPSVSATHIASGSVRVIPTTIEEGEAAGTAAALADREKLDFIAMAHDRGAIDALQAALVRAGAILSYEGKGQERERPGDVR